jgi:hypothetical protein
MNVVTRKACLISTFFLVVSACVGMAATPKNDPAQLRVELNNILTDFAEKHSLDGEQLHRMLGDMVLNGRALSPGGIGPIDRGTYVVLDDERNSLIVNRKKWQGESFQKIQVVITDGKTVLAAPTIEQVKNLRIVIFSPSEARIIDPSTNTGASYPRNVDTK